MTRLIRSFGEIARKVQRCTTIWAILEGNGGHARIAQDATRLILLTRDYYDYVQIEACLSHVRLRHNEIYQD